jgi:hypothetical protein
MIPLAATYGPCAKFIMLAHKAGFHPTFVNVSFVGADALAKELGADGEGVVVSQVVPFPWDTSLKSSPTTRPPKRLSISPCQAASFRWRVSVGPPCGRRSRTGGAAPDPCRPVAGRPRGRPVRYQRKRHHRRAEAAAPAKVFLTII